MLKRRLLHHFIVIVLVVAGGGFTAATLVRMAPGNGVDENLLDPNLSEVSKQALMRERHASETTWQFYGRCLRSLRHGDLGKSQSLDQPIATLIRDRAPATLRLVTLGLLIGWCASLGLAISTSAFHWRPGELLGTALSGLFLSLPAAALALFSVMWNLGASLAIGLIVFPRVYRYASNLLRSAYDSPHIIMARAKGLGRGRILAFHVLPVIATPLLAVFGVSVTFAIGAAIPIEALCGIPGLGQLAWQAALSRDLPLIVYVTTLVSLLTVVANSVADAAATAVGEPAS